MVSGASPLLAEPRPVWCQFEINHWCLHPSCRWPSRALCAAGPGASIMLGRQQRGRVGAGDLRRALAAAERLVLLCGDAEPVERRDAAVLLALAGYPDQVRPCQACAPAVLAAASQLKGLLRRRTACLGQNAELLGRLALSGLVMGPRTLHRQSSTQAVAEPGLPAQALAEMRAYNASRAARQASTRDADLAGRLTDSLQSTLGPSAGLPAPMSVQTCLQQPSPQVDTEQRTPLTW